MEHDWLLQNIKLLIGLEKEPSEFIDYKVLYIEAKDGYEQQLIEYYNDGNRIPAYLLIPECHQHCPAVLIHHQHNGERHLGKSEVCGLAGNPLQAFGPALAQKGFVVLSPDSICFEDRRTGVTGIHPLENDGDFLQHYNEMCYRIIKGDTLQRTVLSDAMAGISVLLRLAFVDQNRIGTLGHSYGGNNLLFHMAVDKRISFGCASGSACTYKNRMDNNVGIEMASVIPGFNEQYDIDDLIKCIAPRKLLIVSADNDKYSKDADYICQKVKPIYEKHNAGNQLQHKRYHGGHAMTEERFVHIVNWFCHHFS